MTELANPTFDGLRERHLQWLPQVGLGYLEVTGEHYDGDYFANYRKLADTAMGRMLNDFRVGLVRDYFTNGPFVLDVGIGDGAFLRAHAKAGLANGRGYDVNPVGVEWLHKSDLWGDLYARSWPAATFWDSLEHIRDPARALAQVDHTAIVSLPVFDDAAGALASKHYKPHEHFWYFTRDGFEKFANGQGFTVLHWTNGETILGREGIETFVLRRRRG